MPNLNLPTNTIPTQIAWLKLSGVYYYIIIILSIVYYHHIIIIIIYY